MPNFRRFQLSLCKFGLFSIRLALLKVQAHRISTPKPSQEFKSHSTVPKAYPYPFIFLPSSSQIQVHKSSTKLFSFHWSQSKLGQPLLLLTQEQLSFIQVWDCILFGPSAFVVLELIRSLNIWFLYSASWSLSRELRYVIWVTLSLKKEFILSNLVCNDVQELWTIWEGPCIHVFVLQVLKFEVIGISGLWIY